jgi:hypothetical protein
VGVYIKSIEHDTFEAINWIFQSPSGTPTVMKGLNADQRGQVMYRKWKSFANPVALGLDGKRFDQHVHARMLMWEHSYYNAIFRCSRLRKLLRWQVDNHGRYYGKDGKIKYRKQGSRMSGDMNTALGNVLIMCAMVYAYMTTKNIRYEYVNDGDDCVLIVEREHLSLLDDVRPVFLKWGFYMDLESPASELELVQFCQANPIEIDPGVWRMVRDPRVCLTKDAVSLRAEHANEHDIAAYRNAVGTCGLALCHGVPVMESFYRSMRRGCESYKPPGSYDYQTGMFRLSKGMKYQDKVITDSARLSFWKAFDITPPVQRALEMMYDTVVIPIQIATRTFAMLPEVLEECGSTNPTLNGVRKRNPANAKRLDGVSSWLMNSPPDGRLHEQNREKTRPRV